MTLKLVAVACGMIHLVATPQTRIIEDQTTETLVVGKIAVPPEVFSKQYVMQRAREFLIEHSNRKMIRLTFVPNVKPANYGRVFLCDEGCNAYPFWKAHWDIIVAARLPIAELMCIESNAILRFRDETGSVSIDVLQGRDPSPVHIGGYSGTILHIAISGRIAYPLAQLYIVGTGAVSSEEGAVFARELAVRLGVDEATVKFRQDPWFIEETWPAFFPLFENAGSIPNEQTFKASFTRLCAYIAPKKNFCAWIRGGRVWRDLEIPDPPPLNLGPPRSMPDLYFPAHVSHLRP